MDLTKKLNTNELISHRVRGLSLGWPGLGTWPTPTLLSHGLPLPRWTTPCKNKGSFKKGTLSLVPFVRTKDAIFGAF